MTTWRSAVRTLITTLLVLLGVFVAGCRPIGVSATAIPPCRRAIDQGGWINDRPIEWAAAKCHLAGCFILVDVPEEGSHEQPGNQGHISTRLANAVCRREDQPPDTRCLHGSQNTRSGLAYEATGLE